MRTLPLALVALALAACEIEPTPGPASQPASAEPPAVAAEGGVSVQSPFVAPAPAGGTGGAFMAIVGGAEPDTLIAARYEGAERVEVHEAYETDGGLRGMREVLGIPVPAGETVQLRPGGYHVMLINLRDALVDGDTLALELEFSREGVVTVPVPVQPLSSFPR